MKINKKLIISIIGLIFLSFVIPNETFASSKMPEGTKVANMDVEKLTEEEIRKRLEDEIIIWQMQDDLVLEGEFETFTVSREVFQFNIDETIKQLKNKTKRTFLNFFRKPKNVQIPIVVNIDESHPDIQAINEKTYIDREQVMSNLRDLAANLEGSSPNIPYIEGEEIPLKTIAKLKWEVPDLSLATVSYIVEELDGYVIPANELFSFLQSIEIPEKLLNSKEETSFLASALYTLFLQANFDIVERHPQLTLPSYGEIGVNAEVNKRENKDLVVMNKNDVAYRIQMELSKNNVMARLEGIESLNKFEISLENQEEIEPRTLYRYSKKLNPGESETIQKGEKGLKVDVYRSIYEDGVFINEELISKDVYLPKPKIVLVSPDDPEISEEDLEVELDDDFDEDSKYITDEYGNMIDPSSSNGSISEILPDEIDEEVEYEAIKELEDLQRQYEQFLDRMLEEYAKSLEGLNEDNLILISELRERVNQFDRMIAGLITNLIRNEILEKDYIYELFEQGLVNENFIEVFVENGLVDDDFLEQWEDGANDDA